MKQLIIRVSDFLKTETVERKVDKFEEDLGYPSNISVYLKAVKISDDAIFASVAVEGYVTMECARCVSVYKHPIEIYFEKDMDFLNGQADVGDEVRQQIILEIPSKPLCNQECLGICATCGKHNKETDKCNCSSPQDDFVKQRWQDLINNSKKQK